MASVADLAGRDTEPLPRGGAPAPEPAPPGPPGLSAGAHVDRYLVLGVLGQGGMGVVLRAYDPELHRELAIKVVRVDGAPAPAESRRRLVREAQALARVSHPNVITVLDVGTRDDDVFVAMELVDGVTLRRWLEAAPAPARVLEAFLAAGQGLAAAHEAGLVHRDFKPENVMIGPGGRVRVLDFGLAGDLGEETPAGEPAPALSRTTTAAGGFGTPRYMAPEQRQGGRAEARSDQFAFCVALHEALYGVHPFAGAGPETMAGRARAGALTPHLRGFGGERLFRAIARGLAGEPGQRFPSMRALLAALEPARRRRGLVPAGIALAALAAVGASFTARPAAGSPCENAAASVETVWSAAARARVEAAFPAAGLPGGELASRLAGALDGYAGGLAQRQQATCRATRELGTQSEMLMDLRMRCLGRRVVALGSFVEHVSRTRDRRVLLDALERADELPGLAACDDDDALLRAAPLPDAPAAQARVVALERELDGLRGRMGLERAALQLEAVARVMPEIQTLGYAPLEAQALQLRGELERDVGQLPAAGASQERAALLAARGRDDLTVARAWVALIDVRSHQSAYEQAHTLEPVATAAIERAGGAPELAAARDLSLGWVLREQARYDEARQRYEALIARLGADGRESRQLAVAENGLGVVAKEQGRYDEAIRHYERAIAIYTHTLGADHPETAQAMNNLAVTLRRQGKLDDALVLYRRVRDINERMLPVDHPDRALPLANMANIFGQQDKLDEAYAALAEARRIWEKSYGRQHLNVGMVTIDLASIVFAQGRAEEASELTLAALAILEEVVGKDGVPCADAHRQLATIYLARGMAGLAVRHAARGVEIYTAKGAEPSRLGRMELTYAKALWAAGDDRREARRQARSARDHFRGSGAADGKTLAETEAWLASHR